MVPVLLSLLLLLGPAVPKETQAGNYSLSFLYTGLSKPRRGSPRPASRPSHTSTTSPSSTMIAKAGGPSPWPCGARWKAWRTGRRRAPFRGPGRISSWRPRVTSWATARTVKGLTPFREHSAVRSGITRSVERSGCTLMTAGTSSSSTKKSQPRSLWTQQLRTPSASGRQRPSTCSGPRPTWRRSARGCCRDTCPTAGPTWTAKSLPLCRSPATWPQDTKGHSSAWPTTSTREASGCTGLGPATPRRLSGGDVLPSGNGTYQSWVVVGVPSEDPAPYSCHVEHRSLAQPLTVPWDPQQQAQ
uniref:Uncharacterized protein n=1 Tax=Rangifer tarandus platyrhynchus TaxID=3082113 RepID=A0ACB0F9S4_RANTA|nr:unnamed protein product [Rangifer tarandus platyrhynchus]